jgi:hypothetical protein
MEAINNYNHAIKINPNLTEAYIGRGKAMMNLKKYSDAIK